MFHLPVTPSECALAIGIPVSCNRVRRDLKDPDRHHFASLVAQVGEKAYRKICRTLVRVCREVTRRGVRAEPSIRRERLGDLFRRFKVVTLVSHFRLLDVRPADIKDVVAVWQALQQPKDPVLQTVSAAGRLLCPALFASQVPQDAATLRADLTQLFNRLLVVAHWNNKRDQSWDESAQVPPPVAGLPLPPLEKLSLVALEQSFGPELLIPRPCLELADGLWTAADIIEKIPAAFSGVVELCVCNSVVLGTAIRRERSACRAVVNEWRPFAEVPVSRYAIGIAELAQRPQPYLELVARVREAIVAG